MPYNATDHTKWRGAKHCPPEGQCLNCMPLKGKDTCWAIERPVKYYLTSWGNLDKGEDVSAGGRVMRGGTGGRGGTRKTRGGEVSRWQGAGRGSGRGQRAQRAGRGVSAGYGAGRL